MDEIDLDLVGGLQRLVALAQRPLDVDRVGDVLERDQRGAVRQRHGGAIDDAAVVPLEPAGDRLRGRRAPVTAARSVCQIVFVGMQRPAPVDHGLDVRAARASAAGVELPHPREGRIEQPQAAVAAEHRDASARLSRVSPCTRISAS